MNKSILSAILVSALAVTMSISAIHPAKAYIYSTRWFGQEHDYDPFWGSGSAVVFPENTTARLMVTVYNSMWWADLNVSAVKVNMDWTNENYSSTQCSEANPMVMSPYTFRTFTINFTVPSTSVASNLFQHYYTIYVEEVNATSGPQQVSLHDMWSGGGFIVYSTVQKEAQVLYDEINILFDYYYYYYFSSVEAQILWYEGSMYYEMAEDRHQSGNFDDAKTYYEDSLDLLNQAIAIETMYDSDWQQYDDDYERQMDALYLQEQQAIVLYQEALGNATLLGAEAAIISANATMRQADAEFAIAEGIKMQANAWVLFGVGFIVFGFAAVVWAYRRPIGPPS